MLKKRVVLAGLLLVLLLGFILPVLAGEYTIFGPQRYERGAGKPATVTSTFASPVIGADFTLRLINGDEQERNRVASGSIALNGAAVAGTADFNQQVQGLERSVPLSAQNTLSVQLASSPGSYLLLSVVGVDNVPPQLNIITPINGSVITSASVDFLGSVVDATPVTVRVNGTLAKVEGTSFTVVGVPLAYGENQLIVSATDLGGNTTSNAITVNRPFPSPIATINIEPAQIKAGESAVLNWSTTNADTISIAPEIGPVAANGTLAVSPSTTTSYTMTAVGPGGYTTATTELVVEPALSPPTAFISARPATVKPGGSTILTWITSNANQVRLEPRMGFVDPQGSITVTPRGSTTYTIIAEGAGGSTSFSVDVTVEEPKNLPIISITATPTTIMAGQSSTLSWTTQNADAVTIEPGIGSVATTGAVVVSPASTTSYVITAYGAEGVVSSGVTITIKNFVAAGSYGAQYQDLIPPDTTKTAYDSKRFALVTGEVRGLDNQPLQDVTVSMGVNSCVLCHGQEYGTVKTNAEGRFSLPVEGGSTMTVTYNKPGFIAAHRQVYVPWNDIAVVDTLQILPEDSAATTVVFDGNPETIFVHRSTPATDVAGSRATTLVFQGDNHAYEVDAAGNTLRELPSFIVRATEFVTPESMPANLPPTSAYTYCVELSVDGVARVKFDKPFIGWVDNFLGFEVGDVVPVGYYNRDRGVWIAAENGVVVRLLDTDNDGKADAIDADGDNFPDDLNSDGHFNDEVQGLIDSQRYPVGATFWRFKADHFTPYDLNWAFGIPLDAIEPNPLWESEVEQQDAEEEPCDKSAINSFVEDRSRIFHEDIPIPGTDVTLHYASNRVKGYIQKVSIPVSGDSIPGSVVEIKCQVNIAGRIYGKTLPPIANQKISIEWDGTDYLGRPVPSSIKAEIKIGFVYKPFYSLASRQVARSFGENGVERTAVSGRAYVTLWKEFEKEIHLAGNDANEGILLAAGWSISNQHILDRADLSTIFKGDGTVSRESVLGAKLIAGGRNGLTRWDWIQYSSSLALGADIEGVNALATDAAGNIYFSDGAEGGWSRIGKIDTKGAIKAIANEYYSRYIYRIGYNGDNQPAVNAWLNKPQDLAVDAGGNIYIADTDNNRIRKIDNNGIIRTIAGNGTCNFSGDGGDAANAVICRPSGIALDNSGNLYIADSGNARIRKIDSSGRIRTVAGNGVKAYAGDGGPALSASLNFFGKIAVDHTGNIYVADTYNYRVRKIDSTGIITTFVGTGIYGLSVSGTPATQAKIYAPTDVDVDQFGNLLVGGDGYLLEIRASGKIWHIRGTYDAYKPVTTALEPAPSANFATNSVAWLPNGDILAAGRASTTTNPSPYNYQGYSFSGIWEIAPPSTSASVASADQISLFGADGLTHVFNDSGLHLATKETLNDKVITSFAYDDHDRLASMTDQHGNVTLVQRDSNGRPVSITSASGLTTALVVDENNHLLQATYPDGTNYQFEYSTGGLMTSEEDPNGNRFFHEFDLAGRVKTIEDPEGGRWSYARSEAVDGTTTVTKTTAEGNVTTYYDRTLFQGPYSTTIVGPGGDTMAFTRSDDSLSEATATACGMNISSTYKYNQKYFYKDLIEKTETTPAGKQKHVLWSKSYPDSHQTIENMTRNGKVSTLLTDTLLAKREATSPLGRKVTAFYDPANLLTKRLSVAGLLDVTYAYDASGRPTAIGQGERQTAFAYTDQGFLASVTDPEQRTTSYDTDVMGRVIAIHRPDLSSIGFEYDHNGNMTVLENPSSVAHGFDYNGNDAKTGYQTPQSGNYRYTYDKDRRLTETLFPSGRSLVNLYDKDRLAKVITPEGDITLNYLCASKLGSMSKGGEALTYTYDGKLVTSEKATGTLSQNLSYTYNNDFNVTAMTYAAGTVNYVYDNDGLLTGSGSFTITRDAANGLPKTVSGGTYSLTRSFSGYGEVAAETTTISGVSRYGYSLTRSPAGRITAKAETVNGTAINFVYSYDDLGRLLTVSKDGTLVEEYHYDGVGRRIYEMNTAREIDGRTLAYSDEDHLLTAGDTAYQYDLDGFLTTKTDASGTMAYSYSSRGELLKVVQPDGKTIEYIHDPQGRRIAKKVNGLIVEKYLWQGLTRLLAVYNGSNALVARFQYADGRLPVAMTKGGVTYYLGYDQVGSLRLVTDSAGNTVKQVEYDSFGNILADSNSAFAVPFGFAGGLHDRETGLARFGYRDYDPETGRWTAKDPIGFRGGDVDVFGYVQSDPIRFIDAFGLVNTEMVLGGIGEMAGGVVGVGGAAYVTGQSGGTLAPLTVPAAIASVGVFGHGAAKFWAGILQDEKIDIPSTSLTYQASKLGVCEGTANAIDGGVDMLLQFGMMRAQPPNSALEATYEALQLSDSASKVVPVLNGVD